MHGWTVPAKSFDAITVTAFPAQAGSNAQPALYVRSAGYSETGSPVITTLLTSG